MFIVTSSERPRKRNKYVIAGTKGEKKLVRNVAKIIKITIRYKIKNKFEVLKISSQKCIPVIRKSQEISS